MSMKQEEFKSVPKHVAIIMDGNRRFAKKAGFSCKTGHQEGADRASDIIRAAADRGVKVLTLFSFSTENWLRSKGEIAILMALLDTYLKKKLPEMLEYGVRLKTIGNLTAFPTHIQDIIAKAKEQTAGGKKMDLVLALNYGARDEICRAALAFAKDYRDGKHGTLNAKQFSQYLDTADLPDPDLLIRTSGEMRLSNFLLWQISYSEVYVTKALWPEFGEEEFSKAIAEYQCRKRRFGK